MEVIMKNRGKSIALTLTGMALGAALTGGAVAAGVVAEPTWQPIYVDGQLVRMETYNINGSNYVKLRDIGKEVGFNVFWQDGVQIDSDAPYTGEAPHTTAPPTPSMASDAAGEITGNMAIRQDMIDRINQLRREHGLDTLAVDQSLMDAAQECSGWMKSTHQTRQECETALKHGYPHGFRSNITAFTGAGANGIAERAVTNWINSKGHLEALLNPQSDAIGVGVASNGMATFCYAFIGNSHAHNPYA